MFESRTVDSLIQKQVKALITDATVPVDVAYIARRTGVGWGTARYLLLTLALSGEVEAVRTRKSWVFAPVEHRQPGGVSGRA